MKCSKHYFTLASLTLGLAVAAGCGDSEPTPKPSPTKKTSSKSGTKSDGGKATTVAEGWGNLKGRFILDGTPPPTPAPKITADLEYCGKQNVKDESIVVGERNGLANVVVYLRTANPKVHERHKKDENAEIPFANEKCRFEPRICLVRTTQTLKVLNHDPVNHNTNFSHPDGGNNNLVANSHQLRQLSTEVRYPSAVKCNVHDWMKGYVLVRDNPYMAVSKEDGTFEINDLPAGELQFQVWHERSNAESNALVLSDWDQGRFTVTIDPKKPADLGEIKVPASLFK
jgi:hypothetical protein